jgi:WD40 repeat protein
LFGVFAALSVALFFKEREATRARDEAIHARDEATRARDEARATLSRSDFLQALRLIDEDKDFDALAQLARSLRSNSQNHAAACRLATLLAYRNYPTPLITLKHDNGVQSAQFSPDGRKILTLSGYYNVTYYKMSGTSEKEWSSIQVWDAKSGTRLGKAIEQNIWIESAQFSPDGGRILTFSRDNKAARIWDPETGERLINIEHDQPVQSAQFSPDGSRIVTAIWRQRDECSRTGPSSGRHHRCPRWKIVETHGSSLVRAIQSGR